MILPFFQFEIVTEIMHWISCNLTKCLFQCFDLFVKKIKISETYKLDKLSTFKPPVITYSRLVAIRNILEFFIVILNEFTLSVYCQSRLLVLFIIGQQKE